MADTQPEPTESLTFPPGFRNPPATRTKPEKRAREPRKKSNEKGGGGLFACCASSQPRKSTKPDAPEQARSTRRSLASSTAT